MKRSEAIERLKQLRLDYTEFWEEIKNETTEALDIAIASLKTDEAYHLEYESTTKNDLGVDFKLKDYVSREAVRRIIKSPRLEQMLNALNSLRNATECKAEDCINRDYTAKYVEEFANNEYVSQDEAETIYLIADGIRHIPSILPDVHDNNVGNIDCISREQALKELKESAEHHANDCREEVLLRRDRDIIRALSSVTPQPRVDFKELKRKILSEVDGGTDDAWLAYGEVCEKISNSIDEYVQNIKVSPSIRPKGHWIPIYQGDGVRVECSECHERQVNRSNFCPNCGAYMEKVVEK